MPKLTPSEAQAKHARNLKGSLEDIRAGINRVTVAPGAKAAAKADKWQARISAEETKQKWARQVGKVSLQEWKDKAINKGVGRIPGGIDAAASKMTQFYSELFPFQESLQNQVDGMPDLTIEDSVARASAWIRGMSQFKRG